MHSFALEIFLGDKLLSESELHLDKIHHLLSQRYGYALCTWYSLAGPVHASHPIAFFFLHNSKHLSWFSRVSGLSPYLRSLLLKDYQQHKYKYLFLLHIHRIMAPVPNGIYRASTIKTDKPIRFLENHCKLEINAALIWFVVNIEWIYINFFTFALRTLCIRIWNCSNLP